MLKTKTLFDLNHTMADAYLNRFEYPWQALNGIRDLILELGKNLGGDYTEMFPSVWVHKTAVIAPSASITS